MSGHRDDRQVTPALTFRFSNCRGCLEAVHPRHLHIHEHDIETVLFESGKCFETIIRDGDTVPASFEQPDRKPLVCEIVLSQQYT